MTILPHLYLIFTLIPKVVTYVQKIRVLLLIGVRIQSSVYILIMRMKPKNRRVLNACLEGIKAGTIVSIVRLGLFLIRMTVYYAHWGITVEVEPPHAPVVLRGSTQMHMEVPDAKTVPKDIIRVVAVRGVVIFALQVDIRIKTEKQAVNHVQIVVALIGDVKGRALFLFVVLIMLASNVNERLQCE